MRKDCSQNASHDKTIALRGAELELPLNDRYVDVQDLDRRLFACDGVVWSRGMAVVVGFVRYLASRHETSMI